jgi:hypothetical protein
MQKLEPIFSRQEQAVVYLFSRYWEQIPEFKSKRICRIHTHFPDFSIVNADGKEESIEFEYGLSAFRSHLEGECLHDLHCEGIRLLYLVYWDENDDKYNLRSQIKKVGFTGKVKFVCLKDYFSACVIRAEKTEPWQASWTFTKTQTTPRKAYTLEKIETAVTKLELARSVERLDLNNNLYRMMGFDKSGADFIECDHWERIRFFTTTTRFAQDQIPRKLFIKPNDCKYFNGYFDIKSAFEIRIGGLSVKRFFKDFYFYDYEYDCKKSDAKVKCFVCDFKRIDYERGAELYNFLQDKYTLGVRGSVCVNNEKHIAKIDAIISKQDWAKP